MIVSNLLMKKIIVNLAVNLTIPFLLKIRWVPNLYDAIINKKYTYYDYHIETLSRFLYYLYGESFIVDYLLFLVFILIPFQLIKDYYSKKYYLSFIHKCIILMIIIITYIIIIGLFYNIWVAPWWYNFMYLLYSFIFSVIINTFFYFLLEKKNAQFTGL